MANPTKTRRLVLVATVMSVMLALSFAAVLPAHAATTITAYKATAPVKIDGVVSPGEWNDTPLIAESTSGISYAFKQNGTGLLFLLEWKQSSQYCYDKWCFGGIEIANSSNYGEMGSATTPTIMILLSTGFQGNYDEFISTGDTTPTPVEQSGYTTQSVCALVVSNGDYTAECYRPFSLNKAAPGDPFPILASGSQIEIAFAVGEFSSPGLHMATDMATYTLAISSQTYTPTTTTTTSNTGTASTGSSTSSQSTTSMNQSTGPGQSFLAGFPGLNLITLIVLALLALLIGALLGIGVALRARKVTQGK